MTTECSNCLGTGIVGQGERPWLHEGRKEVCSVCSGTGQILEPVNVEVSQNEVQPEPVNITVDETVDNSNLSEGSSDGSQESVNEPVVDPVEVPAESSEFSEDGIAPLE